MGTIQIPRVAIIFIDHGGVMPMVKVHYVHFDINIMKIFGCSLLLLKWMSTLFFVLLQGCKCFFVFYFIFSVKFLNKPNMGK